MYYYELYTVFFLCNEMVFVKTNSKTARRRKRSFRGIEAESKIAHSRAKRAAVLILRSKTERKRSFLRLGRTKKAKL